MNADHEDIELLLAEAEAAAGPEAESGLYKDSTVAYLLAQEYQGKFRHAAGMGWLCWDGKRWQEVADKDALEATRQWVIRKYAEAQAEVVTAMLGRDKAALDRAKDEVDNWLGYQSGVKIRTITGMAQGIEGVNTNPADFDGDPDLLNVQNGVVDLRTGELLPHDPDRLMTKITNAQYVPEALVKNKDWQKALGAVPADALDWWQVRMGQAITGHRPPDDVMLVQQGSGANGKSTLMVGMERALGDYYLVVPAKALVGDPKSHTTELTEFQGRRLAVLEELPEGNQLNVQRLKQTVGTPTMSARRMRQDEMTFTTTHSLVINTNHMPGVNDTDYGTWRRLLLLRFPYTFTAEPTEDNDRPGDTGLRQRIERGRQSQHDAILAWLVLGARSWYDNDEVMPDPPESVVADTEEWRSDSDLVYSYVTEHLVRDPGYYIVAAEMYEHMRGWLKASGNKEWSDKLIAGRFRDHDMLKGITRERIRASKKGVGERSEPPNGWCVEAPKDTFWAYLGVRFPTKSDQRKRSLVQHVQPHSERRIIGPHVRGERKVPAQAAQNPQRPSRRVVGRPSRVVPE